jgi:hypothetical protein
MLEGDGVVRYYVTRGASPAATRACCQLHLLTGGHIDLC